jgi:hypothetical protein
VSRSGLVAGALAVAVATAGCRGRDRAAVGALADAMGPIDARPGRALTADDLERLAALVVPGAAVEVAARTERDLALVVRSDRARATVTAAGCLACTPPTLAAWEEQRAVLAALWGAENVGGAAAGSLTIAALEVGGLPAITLDVRRGEGRAGGLRRPLERRRDPAPGRVRGRRDDIQRVTLHLVGRDNPARRPPRVASTLGGT